ncbi:MAG: phosphoribosylformylglycinamidine cyclo-ligase [Deltaproteobacteria bacterium]|nr:phosphoribosylformylglycinamidine cyclo-ligase [Deltaproteobacteria bacterium]
MTYRQAGVDIDAGEAFVERIRPAVKSTMRPEVLAGVGGFASLVSIPGGYEEPVLVSGTDGVGTKLKVAFMVDDHRTVGIDLVAMCANDVLAVGAEPLFFLDYYACAKLEPEQAAQVVEGIAEGCKQAGCALVGGETAELPGFYQPGEYDLAGFVVGVVERSHIVTGENVRAGDAVIGISSAGLHSNGFSLARAVVDRTGASLDEPFSGEDEPLGKTLLEPTRIYAAAIRALMGEVEVRSLAHITGGGLLENIPRTLPEGLGVRLETGWPVPPIFRWIATSGPVDPSEMLRTFNMGIGMTVVVPSDQAEKATRILVETGTPAQIIGRVEKVAPGNDRVVIEGSV